MSRRRKRFWLLALLAVCVCVFLFFARQRDIAVCTRFAKLCKPARARAPPQRHIVFLAVIPRQKRTPSPAAKHRDIHAFAPSLHARWASSHAHSAGTSCAQNTGENGASSAWLP